MTTPARQTYAERIAAFPLRPLRSERMAERAGRLAFQLALCEGRLSRDEQDYLDVLTSLIAAYEDERHPIPDVDSPVDMLRYLIEEHDLTLSELAAATGIKVSTLSEILCGKRRLNLQHVTRLARFFHVSPSLFVETQPVSVAV